MNSFERISIVGNGLSAWMICAFMAKQLQHTNTKITLYQGVDAEVTTVVQSPLPLINDFFKAIDVAPETVTAIHPKLGNAYLFDNKNPFFHVWGQYGAPLGVIEFHQVVMRCMHLNQSIDLNKLSIGSASVLSGRFQKPTQATGSIYSTYESSWSFETEAFLQLLKSICKQLGVEVNGEVIVKLVLDDEKGYVFGGSDTPYECDYLINTVPGLIENDQGMESWFMDLPVSLKLRTNSINSLSALVNKVKVLDESSWLCELTHRNIAICDVYQFVDKDTGRIYVHEKPRVPKGMNFGPAMANLCSPVFSPIDLNLIATKLLLRYFPSPSDGCSVVNEFNKALREAFENLRDITQLCLGELFGKTPIQNAGMALSDQAEYKVNLFKLRGRYPVLENEFFKTEWQIWLLLGLGFESEGVEPMVSFVDDKVVKEHVARVESSVLKELQSVPLVS